VSHTLDMFMVSNLKICSEVELRIHHNLLSRAASLGEVRRIYAHQMALAQCREWLDAKLPNVERLPVGSNAEAARRAAAEDGGAAIAGETAAEIYGLRILAANIEDYRLLQPLAQHGISLTRIESRPSKQGMWEYVFFVDIEGHAREEKVAAALAALRQEAAMLKILGSYPCAVL